MSNLAEKWKATEPRRTFTLPTSIRLAGDVDAGLNEIFEEFPHLTKTQIINDILRDGISKVKTMI